MQLSLGTKILAYGALSSHAVGKPSHMEESQGGVLASSPSRGPH